MKYLLYLVYPFASLSVVFSILQGWFVVKMLSTGAPPGSDMNPWPSFLAVSATFLALPVITLVSGVFSIIKLRSNPELSVMLCILVAMFHAVFVLGTIILFDGFRPA